MDGRGRFHDTIFSKRSWRSLKFGAAYPGESANDVRPPSTLGGRTRGNARRNGTARCQRPIAASVAERAASR